MLHFDHVILQCKKVRGELCCSGLYNLDIPNKLYTFAKF